MSFFLALLRLFLLLCSPLALDVWADLHSQFLVVCKDFTCFLRELICIRSSVCCFRLRPQALRPVFLTVRHPTVRYNTMPLWSYLAFPMYGPFHGHPYHLPGSSDRVLPQHSAYLPGIHVFKASSLHKLLFNSPNDSLCIFFLLAVVFSACLLNVLNVSSFVFLSIASFLLSAGSSTILTSCEEIDVRGEYKAK